jgi:hypothetical protein
MTAAATILTAIGTRFLACSAILPLKAVKLELISPNPNPAPKSRAGIPPPGDAEVAGTVRSAEVTGLESTLPRVRGAVGIPAVLEIGISALLVTPARLIGVVILLITSGILLLSDDNPPLSIRTGSNLVVAGLVGTVLLETFVLFLTY